MNSPKTYGYGVAVICGVIAAIHVPAWTHHLHWKAALIWGVTAVVVAIGSAFFPDKTPA